MSENSNNSGKAIIIVAIIVVVLAGLGGSWYWFMYLPEQEAKEKARLEQIAKEEAAKKAAEKAKKDKERYNQLMKEGDAAFELEDWQTARTKYSDASSILPNEQKPKDQLAIVNAKLAEIAEQEARRAAGVVERIDDRTGRFYVVVSSSIDEDLAMDYANKLAKEGNVAKIIKHDTQSHVFYRVSLADYSTREEAESAVPSYDSYGEGVWALKY